jgi:hypothetical protein
MPCLIFYFPLLSHLPTCFFFMSAAPLLSTPAQILHSGRLVSLQHHSKTAVSLQLWTAEHKTLIIFFNCVEVPLEGASLTEHCAYFERRLTVVLLYGLNTPFEKHSNYQIYNLQNIKIRTQTFLNKLRWTANYKCCCFLKFTIPASRVISHYWFFPLCPHYITLRLKFNFALLILLSWDCFPAVWILKLNEWINKLMTD